MASLLSLLAQPQGQKLSPTEIELQARELGMVYRNEILTFPEDEQVPQNIPAETLEQTQPASQAQPVIVQIASGSSPEAIAALLENKGVITDSTTFLAEVHRLQLKRKLRAGTYTFQVNTSLKEVIQILTN